MDLFKTFKTDKAKEQDGAWFPLDEHSKLLIARLNNPRYQAAIQKKANRYKVAAKVKAIPEDVWEDLMNEVIAETILLDWTGITDKGEPLSYSVDNAKRMLSEYPDFRNTIVLATAGEMDNFKEELDENTEKNSVRP